MVSASEKPDDRIAISGGSLVFDYYYHGSISTSTLEPLPASDIKPSDVEIALRNLPPFESRLWLLYSNKPFAGEKQNQIFGKVVKEKFMVQKHQKFEGVEAFLITSHSNVD